MSNKKRTSQELQLLRDEALEAYLNREDFQYDLNADALYQQYQNRYQELGKNAMKDTMGQAAALTGGYGSSYAQNVGQQAYQGYLQKLGDVIPELYQLAYNRYQDEGDQLYKIYQTWSQLEQNAAQQEWQQLQTEKEVAEQESQYPKTDYYAWLNTYQGMGERENPADPALVIKYDNQNVSTGNVIAMQRLLGREETGMWTLDDRIAAAGLDADTAFKLYQRGQLEKYRNVNPGDTAVPPEDIKSLERILGTRENGVWDDEDRKASGGLSAYSAWLASRKGQLQTRR